MKALTLSVQVQSALSSISHCIHYLFCCCPVDCTLQSASMTLEIGNLYSLFHVFILSRYSDIVYFVSKLSVFSRKSSLKMGGNDVNKWSLASFYFNG